MPSVSGSDGSYDHFKKTVDRLEEEYDEQIERARAREDANRARLEKKQSTQRDELERSSADYAKRLRESSAERIAAAKSDAKRDVERAKQEGYDRYGRSLTEDNSDLKRQNQSLAEQLVAQDRAQAAGSSAQRRAEERTRESAEARHARELEEAVSKTQRSLADERSSYRSNQSKDEAARAKSAEDRYAELVRRAAEDVNFERSRAVGAIEERDHQTRAQLRSEQESSKQRFEKFSEAHEAKAARDAEQGRETRMRENEGLRAQVRDLLTHDREYNRSKSEGLRDGVRYYENEYRDRERALGEAYGTELSALKLKNAEQSAYYSAANDANVKDRERYFTKLLTEREGEHHLRERELDGIFKKNIEQVNDLRDIERERAQATLSKQLSQAEEARNQALAKQAGAYQRTLRDQSESQGAQIDRLQGELNQRATTDDPGEVSPAAERTIRKQVVDQYEKTLSAEKESREREVGGLRDRYRDLFLEAQTEATDRLTSAQRQAAAERHLERSELLSAVAESQLSREAALGEQQQMFDRERLLREKNAAWVMDRQRRQMTELVDSSRQESSAKNQALRSEAEFDRKMMHREFAQKQNETIRGYERKLADQKQEADRLLADVKQESEARMRENDRKNQIQMENQGRAYEQRLAQLEQSQKERERFLVSNYEEQLDKMRRSHALRNPKKS